MAGEFSCYLVGTVKVTAGIIESAESEYISNRVIKTSQLQEIRSGQWVTEAFANGAKCDDYAVATEYHWTRNMG